jgi:hypothetical protein
MVFVCVAVGLVVPELCRMFPAPPYGLGVIWGSFYTYKRHTEKRKRPKMIF